MLFNSYVFIFLFLPITFFGYFFLNNRKLTEASKAFLATASLFFYSWWNVKYLPLILLSIVFNYVIGTSISRRAAASDISRKSLLTFGITGNILLLAYFKYADFFIENINSAISSDIPLLNLALPLAISFFTFQQIAFLVDTYREGTREYDFLNYVVFVTFFPQLIAGPIVHHKEMMPQFKSIRNKIKNYNNIAPGIFIFSLGLFKKVVIADKFAEWANRGFDITSQLNLFEAWATSLSYTFQLYFDFSGYTDMAIGAALLFNIKLPANFNSPYKAVNIRDFWRRWHITLSRFLQDYIYIPLGGNRTSEIRTYTNILVTFLIGGLWHGAGWTFILWGGLHGFGLIIHRIWRKLGIKLNPILAWLITFNFINVSWVLFRAEDYNRAMKILNEMFFGEILLPTKFLEYSNILKNFGVVFRDYNSPITGGTTSTWLICAFLIILACRNSNAHLEKMPFTTRYMIGTNIMFILSILTMLSRQSDFLYFNF